MDGRPQNCGSGLVQQSPICWLNGTMFQFTLGSHMWVIPYRTLPMNRGDITSAAPALKVSPTSGSSQPKPGTPFSPPRPGNGSLISSRLWISRA